MKKYLSLLFVFVGSLSSAAIHEVNEYEKNVYYSLTPYLEMNLMDLDGDGGILSFSLTYDGDLARQEMDKVKINYPGYKMVLVTSQVVGAPLKLSIPSVGISEETVLRQGQMGPYLNLQISLKKDQVAKLKVLAKKGDFLNLEIPVQANYSSNTVLEKYESLVACSDLKINRVEDLVLSLSHLKQPATMRYEQTFASYKRDLLQNCFEMDASSVKSFKDVLNLSVRSRGEALVKGSYTDKQNHDVKFNLVPVLKILIN